MDPRFKTVSWLTKDERSDIYDRVILKVIRKHDVAIDSENRITAAVGEVSQSPVEPECTVAA